MSTRVLLSTLGMEFDQHVCLPAEGTRGCVIITSKGSVLHVITTRVDSYSASVLFDIGDGVQWWFSDVYGPQLDAQKLLFRMPRAWLLVGDFKLIYSTADKSNSNVDRAMMGRFRRLLNDVELKEIELLGQRFTWSNERAVPTLVQLDRAFCSTGWETLYLDHLLQSTAAGISDHCPLLLSLRCYSRGKRRFHFESF